MILVECTLDSVVECLAVFWVLVIGRDWQQQRIPHSARSCFVKGTMTMNIVVLPCSACRGQRAGLRTLRTDKKMEKKAIPTVYITMMNVWVIKNKRKQQKQKTSNGSSVGFKVELIFIWYVLRWPHLYTTYLKPRQARFIRLFVFTCYRCGLQVLLAYKKNTQRQKKRKCRNSEAFFLQKQH